MIDMPSDSMTEAGAQRLAAVISYYWAQRGRYVETKVTALKPYAGRSVFVVRSDMVNAQPISLVPTAARPEFNATQLGQI